MKESVEKLPKQFKPSSKEVWMCWFTWIDASFDDGYANSWVEDVAENGGIRCFTSGVLRQISPEGVTISLEFFEDKQRRGFLTVPRGMVQVFSMYKIGEIDELFPKRVKALGEEPDEQGDEKKSTPSAKPKHMETGQGEDGVE